MIVYPPAAWSFGMGSGPVFLANIGCVGSEQNLLECSKTALVGTYCTHSRDVGVRCQRKLYECNNMVYNG